MASLSEVVLSFVINAGWQAAVISSMGLLLARLLKRRSARLRFQLLALTLAGSVFAPVVTLLPRDTVAQVTAVAPPVQPQGAVVVSGLYLAGLAFALLQFAR